MAPRKPRGKYKKHKDNPTSFRKKTQEELDSFWLNAVGEKRCCTCLSYLPMDSFGNLKSAVYGKNPRCKKCANTRSRELHAERRAGCPDHAKKNRASRLRREYGLTEEAFTKMLADQHYCCAICTLDFGTSIPHVDHNHTTGIVRALLCNNCNRGIGHLQESVTILQNAINYLEKHNGK
jgi:hypothetical protein